MRKAPALYIFKKKAAALSPKQAALARARDAERQLALALAAASEVRDQDEARRGNLLKTEPQVAAERELAIKVGG